MDAFSSKVEERWLPHYIQLTLDADKKTLVAKHALETSQFQDSPNSVVYELTGLVVFSRNIDEEI